MSGDSVRSHHLPAPATEGTDSLLVVTLGLGPTFNRRESRYAPATRASSMSSCQCDSIYSSFHVSQSCAKPEKSACSMFDVSLSPVDSTWTHQVDRIDVLIAAPLLFAITPM